MVLNATGVAHIRRDEEAQKHTHRTNFNQVPSIGPFVPSYMHYANVIYYDAPSSLMCNLGTNGLANLSCTPCVLNLSPNMCETIVQSGDLLPLYLQAVKTMNAPNRTETLLQVRRDRGDTKMKGHSRQYNIHLLRLVD